MAYSSSKLNERVTILQRQASEDGDFGRGSAGITYKEVATVWAWVDWSKGIKSMREGVIEAYDYIMVRCRWNPLINRECRLEYNGRVWMIESLHADRKQDQIQITASELVGEKPIGNPCH